MIMGVEHMVDLVKKYPEFVPLARMREASDNIVLATLEISQFILCVSCIRKEFGTITNFMNQPRLIRNLFLFDIVQNKPSTAELIQEAAKNLEKEEKPTSKE